MSSMVSLTNVKNIINEAIKKSKILRFSMINGNWKKIVDKMYINSTPYLIKDNKLYVKVNGSSNLHFMSLKKKYYLKNIEQLLKGNYIDEIIYTIGKVELDNKINSYEIEEVEEKEIEEIKDFDNLSLEQKILKLSEFSKQREKKLIKIGYKKCLKCGSLFLGESRLCNKCLGIKDKTVINKY